LPCTGSKGVIDRCADIRHTAIDHVTDVDGLLVHLESASHPALMMDPIF